MTIKHHRFRLRKCYFGVLALKYKQSGHFLKNADTVWTANSVKYENEITGAIKTQHVRLGAPEREHKGVGKARRSFSLFILNYQIKIKQRFR